MPSSITVPFLAQRADDLRDVKNRLLRCYAGEDAGALSRLEEPVILAARDLMPSETAGLDRTKVLGIVTERGGAASHAAILARSLGIPAVLGVPALMEQVFWILSQTVKNLSYQVRRLSFLSAGERVAAFLLEMTQNPHPSLGIGQDCLPYSHQEIAECTSLQRVTVTRLLQAMKTKGWITTGYKQVRICNRPALQAYAYHNL